MTTIQPSVDTATSPRELDITDFFNRAHHRSYSASEAENGKGAGAVTWANAVDAADEWPLLQTEEQRQQLRIYLRGFGAWSDEEITAWTDAELTALCIQLVAGDIRESGLLAGRTWEQYEVDAQSGHVAGRMYRGDNGRVYFDIGD